MANQDHDVRAELGETSGTEQRPARRLTGPALVFDLARENEQLSQEATWRQGDSNSKTLIKESDYRLVLTRLKRGARIHRHQTVARITIQTVVGCLRLQIGDEAVELPAGHVLALESDIPHDVEALEESAFLLTLVWP